MKPTNSAFYRAVTFFIILTFLSSNVSLPAGRQAFALADLFHAHNLRQTNPGQAAIKRDLQKILGAGADSEGGYALQRTAPEPDSLTTAQPQPEADNSRILKVETDERILAHIGTVIRQAEENSENFAGQAMGIAAMLIDSNGQEVVRGVQSGPSQFKELTQKRFDHAEINTFKEAEQAGKIDWPNYTLIVSLEPCDMCAKAIINRGIKKVVIATLDTSIHILGQGIKSLILAGVDVTIAPADNQAKAAQLFLKDMEKIGRKNELKFSSVEDVLKFNTEPITLWPKTDLTSLKSLAEGHLANQTEKTHNSRFDIYEFDRLISHILKIGMKLDGDNLPQVVTINANSFAESLGLEKIYNERDITNQIIWTAQAVSWARPFYIIVAGKDANCRKILKEIEQDLPEINQELKKIKSPRPISMDDVYILSGLEAGQQIALNKAALPPQPEGEIRNLKDVPADEILNLLPLDYIRLHSKRTSVIAQAIAKKLGLGKGLTELNQMCLAHDLGIEKPKDKPRPIEKLTELGIDFPDEVGILLEYHDNYPGFLAIKDTISKNLSLSPDELEVLIAIFQISDSFERGNNKIWQELDGRSIESFEKGIAFIKKQHYEKQGIKNEQPLKALETLIKERDADLFKVIAESRGTAELQPKDIEFINAPPQPASPARLTAKPWTGGPEVRQIALTGSTGFIGSNLVDFCRQNRINVDSLARTELDLLNPNYDKLNTAMRDNNAFYHLGAISDPKLCAQDPVKALAINTLATAIIAKLAEKNNSRLIFASTFYIYSLTRMPVGMPMKEEDAALILQGDEPEIQELREWLDQSEQFIDDYAQKFVANHGKGLPSPEEFIRKNIKIPAISDERLSQIGLAKDYFYPLTKWLAERFVGRINNSIIVRPSNIYGPGQKENYKVPKYIEGIANLHPSETFEVWSQGARDYLYVEDAARALIRAATTPITQDSKIINVASGKPTTNLEIGQAVAEAVGNKAVIKEGERPDKSVHICDNSRFAKYLHPEPITSLKEGIKKTISYYQPPRDGRDILTLSRAERLSIADNHTDKYRELDYVRKHVERVSQIAELIGEELELSTQLMEILMTAAEVHDGGYNDPDTGAAVGKYHGSSKVTQNDRIQYPALDDFLAHLEKNKGSSLASDELRSAEDYYNHGARAVEDVKKRGINMPPEVELLIRYHQFLGEFYKNTDSFKGRLSIKVEEVGLLLNILFTADIFENGNNIDKMRLFRGGRPPETFDQTFAFLAKTYQTTGISDKRPYGALLSLVKNKDERLLEVTAQARRSQGLQPKDIEFVNAPPQPASPTGGPEAAEPNSFDTLLGGLEHDIGNKLTPVMGKFQIMLMKPEALPIQIKGKVQWLDRKINNFYHKVLMPILSEEDPLKKVESLTRLVSSAPFQLQTWQRSLTNLSQEIKEETDSAKLAEDLKMMAGKIGEMRQLLEAEHLNGLLSSIKKLHSYRLYNYIRTAPSKNQPKVIIAPKELFLNPDIIGLKESLQMLARRKVANGEPEFKVVVPCRDKDECGKIEAMKLPGVSARDFPDFNLNGLIPGKAVIGILNPTGGKNLGNVIVIAKPLGSSYMSANPLHIDPEVNYLTQHGCNVLVPEIPEGKDTVISAFKIFHSAVDNLNKENNGSIIYIQPVELPSQIYRQIQDYLQSIAEFLEKA